MGNVFISYQDENGNPIYREATEEEIADMQPVQLTWHKEIGRAHV